MSYHHHENIHGYGIETQAQEEKKKEKKIEKKRKLVPLQKGKVKPSGDIRKKRKQDKDDSPAIERRPIKKRVLKLL